MIETTELREAAEQQRQITQLRLKKWLGVMKRISTHVLDTARGKPAEDVPVQSRTAANRRASGASLLRRAPMKTAAALNCCRRTKLFAPGIYRLAFDTGTYYRSAERRGTVSRRPNYVSGARRRIAFSHSAAAEPAWLHDVSGKLNHMITLAENSLRQIARPACASEAPSAAITIFANGPWRFCSQGDFESCFTDGDNSKILPTDTMKNTVYSLARNSSAECIEDFAQRTGRFSSCSAIRKCPPRESALSEKTWEHLETGGKAASHRFYSVEWRTPDDEIAAARRAAHSPFVPASKILSS